MIITDRSLFSQFGYRDWEITYPNSDNVGSALSQARVQPLFMPVIGLEASGLPLDTHISDLGRLRLAFETLLTSLQTLGGAQSPMQLVTNAPNTLRAHNASSLLASSINAAPVVVWQLAQRQEVVSDEYADHDRTHLGTGVLLIQQGEWNPQQAVFTPNRSREIHIENGTLDNIIDRINQADAGVEARLINLDSGYYQLGLSSTQTGRDAAFALAVLDDDGDNTGQGGLSQLFYRPPAFGYLYTTHFAQNSQLSWEGKLYQSHQNDIETLANALGFSLYQAGEARIGSLQDPELFVQGVNDLVNGYNQFIQASDQLVSQPLAEAYRQPLATVIDKLAMGYPAQNISLSNLGITRDTNQQLKLNNEYLETGYQQHASASEALLGKTVQLLTQASSQGLQLTEASLQVVDARQPQNLRQSYFAQLLREVPLFPETAEKTTDKRIMASSEKPLNPSNNSPTAQITNPTTATSRWRDNEKPYATPTAFNPQTARLSTEATTNLRPKNISLNQPESWLSTRFAPVRPIAQTQMYAAIQLQQFFTTFEQAMSAVA